MQSNERSESSSDTVSADGDAAPGTPGTRSAKGSQRPSRTGAAWTAVTAALLLLVLLVVFILQNQADVRIKFLGWSGTTPVGVALLVAAVAAGVLVGIAATARVTQLRRRAKRG